MRKPIRALDRGLCLVDELRQNLHPSLHRRIGFAQVALRARARVQVLVHVESPRILVDDRAEDGLGLLPALELL